MRKVQIKDMVGGSVYMDKHRSIYIRTKRVLEDDSGKDGKYYSMYLDTGSLYKVSGENWGVVFGDIDKLSDVLDREVSNILKNYDGDHILKEILND